MIDVWGVENFLVKKIAPHVYIFREITFVEKNNNF